ncbi:helix-turn-helix transcriptional regulator [Maribacter algarum]|nr:helix-turn-helix transcriptional regulator [Maribacter algarum]
MFIFIGKAQAQQDIFEQARAIRNESPDKSLYLLESAYRDFLKKGDTTNAIKALLEMPFQYGQKVDYAKSYDGLWLALFLADESKDDVSKAAIYNRLGRLYSFFKKEGKAFEYLNTSLKIKKNLVGTGELNEARLVQNYYLICATYRELDKPNLGRIYLDSCFLKYDKSHSQIQKAYLDFEKSFILSQEKKNQEAIALLTKIEPWFKENRPSYLVLVYTYWGDIYRSLEDLRLSEIYYAKALDISAKHNSHLDFSILVHERLANLYIEKGDFKKAFYSQEKAKKLDAQFFDSRSSTNQPLLEIKDEFRVEKERQEMLIQKQRLEQLEQQDKISLLQRIILLGALVFLVVIGIIYFRQIRSKYKAEKLLIQRSKELEIQKAKELLELKNKELATSALQLVEKDEFLKEIKNKLKGENGSIKTAEINQILKSISHSNTSNWEEFKLRFTAVNEKFYQKVTKEYPNLSQADQKICALIKLNFSSKEMARLLGISVESVHTTRYRLRKKMKLDRSVNLEDFISSI